MWAEYGFTPDVAGPGFPGFRVHRAGVDGSEGGGGEGGEHGGMLLDGVGDAFAAGESSFDQVIGVGSVGFRAGWADGCASVSAREVEDAVGKLVGVSGGEYFAGVPMDGVQMSGQPNGSDAAFHAGYVIQPLVVGG